MINELKELIDNHKRPYLHIRDGQIIERITESIREVYPDAKVKRVTINKNNHLGWHKHPNQSDISYGLIFGSFSGGELVHSGGVQSDRNVWFAFDGTKDHKVNDFTGDRYSVIAYDR